MNHLRISLLLLFAAGGCLTAKQEAPESFTEKLWVHWDSESIPGPSELDENYRSAYARLLSFDPNGELAILACQILEVKDKQAISRGDGQVVYLGRWKLTARGNLDVTFREVYRSLPPNAPPKPPTEISARVVREGGSGLLLNGDLFTLDRHLSKGAVDEYVQLARASSRSAAIDPSPGELVVGSGDVGGATLSAEAPEGKFTGVLTLSFHEPAKFYLPERWGLSPLAGSWLLVKIESETRSYELIPRGAMPKWPHEDGVQSFGAGQQISVLWRGPADLSHHMIQMAKESSLWKRASDPEDVVSGHLTHVF